MAPSRTFAVLSTPDPHAVERFLDETRPAGCARLATVSPSSTHVESAATDDSAIVGYAQATAFGDEYTVDCVSHDPAARAQLVTDLIAALPASAPITWWGHELPGDEALAAALGMPAPHRRLLNMSRSLPLESAIVNSVPDLSVRPFLVGHDETAWLQVNNAAFSWHNEQGEWDLATLRGRLAEPWFDATGFLMHEREGRLAGFCWTKVHGNGSGEIYVIAVHPDFHGLGLGRALTVAGLRHLASIGSTKALLYVEADNTAAVRLYASLGFDTIHTDVAYRRLTNGDSL